MTQDLHIQQDVEALRAQFPDTKALYREVCGLLFFRYGITPTASRLYQLVRKGSMGTPAEVLSMFWQELRGKAKTELDHPDLPQELKTLAGQVIHDLWGRATELARDELATLRTEVQAEALAAQDQVARLHQAQQALKSQIAGLTERAASQDHHLASLADELEQERRNTTAANAVIASLQRQKDELKQEHARSRDDFRQELEKGRDAINRAAQRATEAEHRALREIDLARTGRNAAEKQWEALRQKTTDLERQHHVELTALSMANTQLAAELDALKSSADASLQDRRKMESQTQDALQALAASQAETQALHGLIEKLTAIGSRKRPAVSSFQNRLRRSGKL